MTRPTVYLAGPIFGCDKTEANDWRFYVANKLSAKNILGVSPLRCEPLVGQRYSHGTQDPKFGTARAIASKNMFDVRNCDITLAYLPTPLDGRHQSYGTICELAWASMIAKPTILVSDDPSVLNHPVVNACAGWVLTDLDEALEVMIGILGGYNGGKNV